MESITLVQTGALKTGDRNGILKSTPIGSCVAVVLFDETSRFGAMAHIMLPGKAPEKENVVKCKYAQNAIVKLICELTFYGANKKQLKAVVVGGGNVLKRENDTIGIENLDSVNQQLTLHGIEVVAESVKGTDRKSVKFDIAAGIIYFTSGDEPEKELYRIFNESQMLIDSPYEKSSEW